MNQTAGICPSCGRHVQLSSMYWPFDTNECEQRAQIEAGRRGPPPVVLAQVTQLDLETARAWEPKRFDVGTLESILVGIFEPHEGVRYPRAELLERAKQSRIGKVNERNVMDAIRELRRGGWPIISSSGEEGYWLSWEPADLDQLEQTLRGRSLDMLKTLSAVRRARSRVGWVPVLDDMISQLEKGEI